MINCLTPDITHWFLLRNTQQLQTHKGYCLNVIADESQFKGSSKFKIILESCWRPSKQTWQRFGLQLKHSLTGLCLEITVDFNVTVNPCRREAPMQYFIFEKELERI